jgi:hypothetical protein
MQHNGLPAERFAPVADVAAGAVDGLLTALRAAAIAAYVVPIGPGDQCRLWVDETATSSARATLIGFSTSMAGAEESHSADHDHVDDDAAWAEIVASFHASPDAVPIDAGLSNIAPPDTGPPPPAEVGRDQAPPADEHFEPPTPPPLPTGDVITRLAWAGVVGGPAYLFVSVVVGWAIQPWAGALALTSFVAGFITLVARMRDDDEPRDDNGAVV